MQQAQMVKASLHQLQSILEEVGLWQNTPPSSDALVSIEPFAIDTLTATEWLQWIFIPRMHALIEGNLSLPTAIIISPYIEEALALEENLPKILQPLMQIEALLNTSDQ